MQFKCLKQLHFKLFSLVNKVIWFQVLLCITNNSIRNHSFVYMYLNEQTALFLSIQFSLSSQFNSIRPIDRTLSVSTIPG